MGNTLHRCNDRYDNCYGMILHAHHSVNNVVLHVHSNGQICIQHVQNRFEHVDAVLPKGFETYILCGDG